jgi:hypothetical protein
MQVFFKRLITLKLHFFLTILVSYVFCSSTFADSPYHWYTFNIPPFGSDSGQGIGYELVNAYIEAGFNNSTVLVSAARWKNDMQDPSNNKFCSSGSWKLPGTSHRVYSDSIINTVDYGVAVRPELYKKLSHNGKIRVVSILDVIESTKSAGNLLILDGRPLFGKMSEIIENSKHKHGTKIKYMSASEGPVSMLKMANITNRNIDSVLIFPEELPIFAKGNPNHSLEYLMLLEGNSFAPIRANCPDTKVGRSIISEINKMLNEGLREKAFWLFLDALPNHDEIREQAIFNQRCIKDSSCKDPLINVVIKTEQ